MIKNTITIILVGFILLLADSVSAQREYQKDLQYKYDIYRARFSRHFIVHDKTGAGCINDGIGMILSQDSTQCKFTKEGFGLPATSLWIAPNGAGVVGRRSNNRMDHDCNNFGISWFGDKIPKEVKGHRFNWLDYGSETLTQSGWMFVMLATEYEIYGRQGKKEKQQEVLEEIFLGLQAIRRLDMHTQHLLDRTYKKRQGGHELVCRNELVAANKIGWWNNCHRSWDTRVKKDAFFTPDFSGYTGFMIRCDAGQNLENFLDDPMHESWNVDMIGGAFGGINSVPLDACEPLDSMCYLVNEQHFISHDQIINLFYGFLFLNKFIPPEATISTCNGEHHNPISIMKKISNGIMSSISRNHITLPGSKENCGREIRLSECEGGNISPTIYGLTKVNNILQNEEKKVNLYQKLLFKAMSKSNSAFNSDFYYKMSAGYLDYSFLKKRKKKRILNINKNLHKSILLIGNDVLFPEGESMSEKIGGEAFFKKMLTQAPLDGPCHDDRRTMKSWPYGGGDKYWPRGFSCDNVVGWEGHRWATNDWAKDGHIKNWTPPVRTNGLDYLALHNIYLLRYGKWK